MMLIIRCFSLVVPSLTRHLYNKKESVQIIVGKLLIFSYYVIKLKVVDKEMAMSTLLAITYSLDTSTEQVIHLHLVEL